MSISTTIPIRNQSIPIPAFNLNVSHLGIGSISMEHLDVSNIKLNQSFQSVFNIFICMFVVLIIQTVSLLYLVCYTRKNGLTRSHHRDPCFLKLDE